jgi:hypothetical protein
MESKITRQNRKKYLYFLILILIGCITYAPLLSQLGFYRDDWYQLWALKALGAKSLVTLFSIDRPAMGYLYAATSSLLGTRPLYWHLYSLALRLTGGVVFLAILRRLWPDKDRATFIVALLSLIYPGFLQQPNANTFSNHLFTYTMALVSIWLTTVALQTGSALKKGIFTVLATVTALLYFPIYEYMIGLEGLRFGIIWLHLARNSSWFEAPRKQWLKLLLKEWWPYFIPIAGFLFWRLVVFNSGRPATSIAAQIMAFQNRPKRTIARLVLEGLKDPLDAILFGWFVPTYHLLASADYLNLIKGSCWTIVATLLTAFFLWFPRQRTVDQDSNMSWAREGMWLGVVASLSTILPVVMFGRDIRWDSGFDRYTLQVTAGAALFVVCFLWYSVREPSRSAFLILLVALSVLTHYLNAATWRDAWLNQKMFWWQMTWRAPRLEPGTVLLTEVAGNTFYEDYEIWGPANLIYNNTNPSPTIFAEVLNNTTLDQVRLGARVGRAMRVLIVFQRDYNHVLVATMPATNSCVHVLDGESLELPQNADPRIQIVARFSHPEQIRAAAIPASIPVEIFGSEPEHGWCYFYQKASLARQQGNWEEVVNLGDAVLSRGLYPADRTEWMPFLMGYVIMGEQQKAQQIADLIRVEEPVRHRLCDEVNRNIFPTPESAIAFEHWLCEFR